MAAVNIAWQVQVIPDRFLASIAVQEAGLRQTTRFSAGLFFCTDLVFIGNHMLIKIETALVDPANFKGEPLSINRRTLLKGAAAMAAMGAGLSAKPASAAVSQPNELGVAAAAAAIRNGEMTAESYAAGLLARARKNADLNSFITLDEGAVLEAARSADLARAAGKISPLLGVPFGIKDSYLTRGLKTTVGTAVLDKYIPDRDAAVVSSIRNAGAIVFGKNNLVEMSYGLTGNNTHYGQVKNPYDKTHVTGGSSSGAGASVAARIVPAALGGDTVGSIRVPASLCGVVGFKPTPGRWPDDGIAPISGTLDTAGILARSVEDCILVDSIVSRSPSSNVIARAGLKGTRIAYAPRQYLDVVDSDIEKLFLENLLKLKDAGAEIIELDLGDDFASLTARATWTIMAREARPAIMEFIKKENISVSFDDIYQDLDPDIKGVWNSIVLPGGPGYSSDEKFSNVLKKDRPELQRRFAQMVFNRADCIIFPTTPCAAPAIANQRKFIVGSKEHPYLVLARNTIPGSCAGLPGISLPAGLSQQGLPVGIEIDAAPGQDRNLLALAQNIESVIGSIPVPSGLR
ncbi:amidase family protein [Undibacterium sp. TJN25]|uniref:amidase family protein n=1 Tax=Undibacterium sp. TJN25 TaxID=3413056 RepID=UPI003BF19D56